jgi:hypothetical protein
MHKFVGFDDVTGKKGLIEPEATGISGLEPKQEGKSLSENDLTDALKGDYDDAVTHAGSAHAPLEAFPIGSVFIAVVSTDPSTLLGYGTWAAFGAGKVLVGIDSGDAGFDTVEEIGGAKTVQSSAQSFSGTQSTSIVNHTHDTTVYVGTTDGTYGTFDSSSTTPGSAKTITTGNPKSGGVASYTPAGTNTPGAATSVVQPYIVVYMWKRTA